MNNYWENKLKRFWLILSAASLLLPLTSLFEAEQGMAFSGVMTGALAILFAFSLPFSVFALPLMAMFKYGIELDTESMFGAYFFIVLLNIFGYLQWFWLMPKYFNHGKDFKLPTILEGN
jgi:hypothetical protein